MLKKEARADYKNRRKKISELSVLNSSRAIVKAALELPIWHLTYFHLFLPIQRHKEINTLELISTLKGKNKKVVVPKINDQHTLKHYLLTDSTGLKTNKWGIPEPVDGIEVPISKIDVVFLPLLAFDEIGNRVGYGKGFYDRFLSECRDEVLKIGLSLFEAEPRIEDVDENDIPLDYCVTPVKTYSFFGSGSGEF